MLRPSEDRLKKNENSSKSQKIAEKRENVFVYKLFITPDMPKILI